MEKMAKMYFAFICLIIFLILSNNIANVKAETSASCPKPIKNYPDLSLVILTKNTQLPLDYIPDDLINISGIIKTKGIVCLKKETAGNLIKMIFDAKNANIKLSVISGFRESDIQRQIYYFWINKLGLKAKYFIAPASSSEHQLGTTVDFSGKSLNYQTPFYSNFNQTPEGKWLSENAYKYGFLMSYPQKKEEITGYKYEPWHYRFIGKEIAAELFSKGLIYREILTELINNMQFNLNTNK